MNTLYHNKSIAPNKGVQCRAISDTTPKASLEIDLESRVFLIFRASSCDQAHHVTFDGIGSANDNY